MPLSATHRTVVRALLGAYLAVHFATLLPVAAELFSNDGMLPAAASPLVRLFPNVLARYDTPAFVVAFVGVGLVAAVALAVPGCRHPRLAAAAAYYVWACLFGRNPLIQNPSLPYVGFLLLVFALAPREGRSWQPYFRSAWIVMAVGYTYSGLTKLVSPSWADGTAFLYVLSNPLARPSPLRDLLIAAPVPAIAALTYGALGVEILFAPLALFPRLRPILWAVMVCMHLGLLPLIDFADLTIGMLVLHAFTFDPAWVRGLRRLHSGRVSGGWRRYAPCGTTNSWEARS